MSSFRPGSGSRAMSASAPPAESTTASDENLVVPKIPPPTSTTHILLENLKSKSRSVASPGVSPLLLRQPYLGEALKWVEGCLGEGELAEDGGKSRKNILVVKGKAGAGKTSLIKSIVEIARGGDAVQVSRQSGV